MEYICIYLSLHISIHVYTYIYIYTHIYVFLFSTYFSQFFRKWCINTFFKITIIMSNVYKLKILREIGQFMFISIFYFIVHVFFILYFIYLFLERGKGRERERGRNIYAWVPLVWSQLQTWPVTQACALIRNRTGDPLVRRLVLSPLSHTGLGYFFVYFIKSVETLQLTIKLLLLDFLCFEILIECIPYFYYPSLQCTAPSYGSSSQHWLFIRIFRELPKY